MLVPRALLFLRPLLLRLGCGLIAIACTRQKALDEVFSEPHPPHSSETSARSLVPFELAPGSLVRFSLGSGNDQITGTVPVVAAELSFDLVNLSRSRVRLLFEMAALKLEPSKNSATSEFLSAAALTTQALHWLQVADRSTSGNSLNFTEFRVLQLGTGTKFDSSKADRPRYRKSGNKQRTVDLAITGALSLHGIRIEQTLPIRAIFQYNALPNPTTITIVSRRSARVHLQKYGVVPRNARGDVLANKVARLAKSDLRTALISFRLKARRSLDIPLQ